MTKSLLTKIQETYSRGAWVAQSIGRLTSAQVMISQFVSLSPMLGSMLTAESLEPALDSVSPSLSVPPLLSLSLSLKNKDLKEKKRKHIRRDWGFPTGHK